MRRFFCILSLLPLAHLAFAEPVITEFMASNQNSIVDEDGDHSDWIEIYNPDNTSVSLENWSLTDNANNLRKWVFPAVTMPAKSYLIVWASSKNRRVPGANLHTNFALSADGEYLGLIKPDGVTKTTEFAPSFPAQYGDISYGNSSSISSASLTGLGTPVKAFIPPNASLGTTWRALGFDDSAWLSGTLAVGYFNYGGGSVPDLTAQLGLDIAEQMGGQQRSPYVRVTFDVADPSKVQSLKLKITYDDAFVAFINGQQAAASALAPASPAYDSLATGGHNPDAPETYDISAVIPQLVAGTNVLALQGFNNSATGTDIFLLPELLVDVDNGAGITGYFSAATPGAMNGGPSSIRLPQTVTFSRPAGVFSSTFSLVLTGAVGTQQIRYVLADPSGSGTSVDEPTMSSTLYTGPISIGSSKLVRAAVFNPDNGQKGATATAEYLQLETAGGGNNTSNFTSILPIAVLDTFGAGGPSGDTYKPSFLHIFEPVNGTASFNAAPTLTTRSGFHVRGSTSASFLKPPYAFETWDEGGRDLKISVLGMPKESDWIWSNPWYFDDVLIHNAFIFQVSREIGRWAPRTRFIETFTNTNGGKLDYNDYSGVYEFMEKIKVGAQRVDIAQLDTGDNTGDAVTGGYIFKVDRSSGDEYTWSTANGDTVLVEPDSAARTSQQLAYIKGYLQTFETTLFNERSANWTTRNYRKYIDVGSWIDHHLLNTLAYNVDALRLSAYFHKDRNGKIKAGPIWDFDRALGSDDGRDSDPRSWNNIDYFFSLGWWGALFRDPDFLQAWIDRWWELRRGVFSDARLGALVDQMGNEIGAAAGARDVAKYPDNSPESGSYLGEIAAMKAWLTSTNSGSLGRTNWLDSQLPGPPTASLASGVVASGTTVSLSGAGPIRYTIDNTDPRPAGGSATSSASTYGAPLTINQTTVLTARRQGAFTPVPHAVGTNWSAPVQRVYLVNESFASAGDLAISEINYDPADPSAAEKAAVQEVSASDFEYIEIKNTSNHVVNTFEASLADTQPAAATKLGAMSLQPGQTVLIVKNKEAFLSRYGNTQLGKIVGEWGDGSLNNGGERIVLLDRNGTPIQDLTYPDIASQGSSLNVLDGTTNKSDVPSPGTDGPSYVQWRDFYFPSGGADSLPTADMDNDGATNALEYAHGTNPKAAESHASFEPVFAAVDETNFSYTYRKAENRPDAHFQVQTSTDLDIWTDVADTLVSATAGVETRKVVVSAGADDPMRAFFRLKIAVDTP